MFRSFRLQTTSPSSTKRFITLASSRWTAVHTVSFANGRASHAAAGKADTLVVTPPITCPPDQFDTPERFSANMHLVERFKGSMPTR